MDLIDRDAVQKPNHCYECKWYCEFPVRYFGWDTESRCALKHEEVRWRGMGKACAEGEKEHGTD